MVPRDERGRLESEIDPGKLRSPNGDGLGEGIGDGSVDSKDRARDDEEPKGNRMDSTSYFVSSGFVAFRSLHITISPQNKGSFFPRFFPFWDD